ncbi:MAG: GTPase Era [Anaerolineaceae bacterium]|nr:GTPase Era [Anaerolineaceae bacterium]
MNTVDDPFDEVLPADHRSGYVAVVGRPNTGKSTLINAILGQKIAIVSPRPQTTRSQQLGILTEAEVQIVFVDTPGLHEPRHRLGQHMVRAASDALRDADVVLWLLDVSRSPNNEDRSIAERIRRRHGDVPVVLALNKADLLPDPPVEAAGDAHRALVAHEHAHLLSALHNQGVADLLARLRGMLPPGPRYFPADQVSEVNLRFIAAEVVREKVMLATSQEIPHAVAVEVDEYRERSAKRSFISAILYVERESQKGILVGKGGRMIRDLGRAARLELEGMLETRIYLELRVKVRRDWRKDDEFLRRLGYRIPRRAI